MRKFANILVLVVLSGLIMQCAESGQPTKPGPSPTPEPLRTPANLTSNESSLLESANKFGLNLFREIAANTDESENIFISPLSVSYAFGICYNGAKGDTRDAIGTTLELAGLSVDDMNEAYRDVTKILTQTDPLVEFKIANSFWSRKGKAIQPDFVDMARSYFDARVEEIDFQAPWAADTINAWVERSTNGKIEDMIEPPIDPNIAAMLMNAIYFKGLWMFPFSPDSTETKTFYLADGSETDCEMMFLQEKEHVMEGPNSLVTPDTNATYYRNDYLEAVSLPYGRGDFRMTILTPEYRTNPDHTIDDLIERFTWANWNGWLEGFHPSRFSIELPKFKFEYEVDLTQILQDLGMEIAFTPGTADFSNMFTDGLGWIDEVKQKAFIQVDEEGTEAAAVTQVNFNTSLPPSMTCNRPFLIVIHEDVSGAILFIGKIANPVWED